MRHNNTGRRIGDIQILAGLRMLPDASDEVEEVILFDLKLPPNWCLPEKGVFFGVPRVAHVKSPDFWTLTSRLIYSWVSSEDVRSH